MPQHPEFRPHPILNHLAIIADAEKRTQKDMTAEDGISREAWRSWLNGERSPGLDILARRAKTLGHKIVLVPLDNQPEPEGNSDRDQS